MPEESPRRADMVGCECEPCKRKAGKPNRVRYGTIHNYTSQPPSGWVVRRTADDALDAATYGVELETAEPEYHYKELPGRPTYPDWPSTPAGTPEWDQFVLERAAYDTWQRENDRYAQEQERTFRESGDLDGEQAVSMAQPRGLWHAKSDASVTGPEFASHPATLNYWRSQYAALASMFQSLLHGGIRSHDGDTCGLHINIGTRSFSGEGHLYRFATLVHASPKWAIRMSQRTTESASHWARFDYLKDEADRREWARKITRYGYCTDHDRYAVLNAQNDGRIEFRLPRGTLRIDRFFAKLEWTASMVEFTRNEYEEPTVAAYLRWVMLRNEYPALIAYLNERFATRVAAAVEV